MNRCKWCGYFTKQCISDTWGRCLNEEIDVEVVNSEHSDCDLFRMAVLPINAHRLTERERQIADLVLDVLITGINNRKDGSITYNIGYFQQNFPVSALPNWRRCLDLVINTIRMEYADEFVCYLENDDIVLKRLTR